jgi:broad specificity phosphatase PhoE
VLVGSGKLIDPAKIAHVFCSPRKRALSTLDMLLGDARKEDLVKEGKLTITEDIAEWDYGDYEGLKPHEIHSTRKEKGLDKDKGWNIWMDGCEGGE